MELSEHASVRARQRAVPPLIREWLLAYGAEVHAGGATKRYFNHDARRRLAAAVGHQVVSRMGNLLNHYLVEGDAKVVTVGVRTKRIKCR